MAGRLLLESKGGPTGRRHHLGLRGSSAAEDPSRFITTGQYLLVDVFVAGHHGLGRKPLLDPGPHPLGVQVADPIDGGGHRVHRGDDKARLPVGHHLGHRPVAMRRYSMLV